jgi:hypothetical protein
MNWGVGGGEEAEELYIMCIYEPELIYVNIHGMTLFTWMFYMQMLHYEAPQCNSKAVINMVCSMIIHCSTTTEICDTDIKLDVVLNIPLLKLFSLLIFASVIPSQPGYSYTALHSEYKFV